MRRNDLSYLGDGVSALRYWVFNAFMVTTWLSLKVIVLFAGIGVNYMFTVEPTPVATSVTSQLGCAFINLMYGISVLVLASVIIITWLLGNVYIFRKELYYGMKAYFRRGDL
jgi:hypothetical protein